MFAGQRAGIDLDEEDALRWITLNAAWALGIHEVTGTLETGKMGDLVIWNQSPFTVSAKAEKVFLEGSLIYDRSDPDHQPSTDFSLGWDLDDSDGGVR